jgi:hypothetical protein
MKKIIISAVTAFALLGTSAHALAHGSRGDGRGSWNGERWAPFAVGALAGAVVANAYYRPAPSYYGPQGYYPVPPQAAAYCPENGLYYPQTQACPSGWKRVAY